MSKLSSDENVAETWVAEILTGGQHEIPEDAEEAFQRGRIKKSDARLRGEMISNVFNESVKAAILEHFENGRSLHAVLHGWIVEIKPIEFLFAGNLCMACSAPAVWVRRTQFAGDHYFCDSCAKKENDFLVNSNPSSFAWEKLAPSGT